MAVHTVIPPEALLPLVNGGLLANNALVAELVAGEGKVLLVDSRLSRRRFLAKSLGKIENGIIEAASTCDAIAAISQYRVDLVVIHLDAPEMGAIEFCRVLRKAPATRFLPIFVMADAENLEAEVLAIEAGADQFLVGPIRVPAFQARVQANLRNKALVDKLDDSESVLFSLAKSVEDRDPELSEHCQRLALIGTSLGFALDLPMSDLVALQRGGYLHDIGKISIPDRVLFKAGPLTPGEWDTMKSHTERGEKICRGIKSLNSVLPIIRSHHERFDGTGYPDGLKGEEIPLLARIMQLADIYDALTTARPYKRAFSADEALAIIQDETTKGWRDPHLVKVFTEISRNFRVPGSPDASRFSLQALAASLELSREMSVAQPIAAHSTGAQPQQG